MNSPCLIEFVEHSNSAAAASVAADEAATWLGICALSGGTSVALPGGRSARRMLQTLAAAPIAWNRITVTTTDERRVPADHRLSNMGNLRQAFGDLCGSRARFVCLDRNDVHEDVKLPFDLVVLGLGADGHIASLFPGSPIDSGPAAPLIEVTPDPIPIEAPVPRRSWSLSALASSQRTLLLGTGIAKRAAIDRALEGQDESPLRALFRRARGVITIHWAEA
ncbi:MULTISPECIES: 6-phosphogluconolactonase [unclassified Sphingobium]|uniref:6-phosphogluconolactonase n=1 Tax=unclassified Sphingobium TaxID=2611147 RepID=UPI0035A73A36